MIQEALRLVSNGNSTINEMNDTRTFEEGKDQLSDVKDLICQWLQVITNERSLIEYDTLKFVQCFLEGACTTPI